VVVLVAPHWWDDTLHESSYYDANSVARRRRFVAALGGPSSLNMTTGADLGGWEDDHAHKNVEESQGGSSEQDAPA
jgi:hypothetical protein